MADETPAPSAVPFPLSPPSATCTLCLHVITSYRDLLEHDYLCHHRIQYKRLIPAHDYLPGASVCTCFFCPITQGALFCNREHLMQHFALHISGQLPYAFE